MTTEQELRAKALEAAANSYIHNAGYQTSTGAILDRAEKFYEYIQTGAK